MARVLAVALPVFLLAALYSFVMAPLLDSYLDAIGRIEAARDRIAHFQAAKTRLPALEASLEAQKRAVSGRLLFPNLSPPETQSALQAAIQKLLTESGVEALSSRLAPPAARGSFTVFEAELDLRASPPQLAKLIMAVEAAEPTLRIEILVLSVPESGQGPVDDEGQPTLSVRAHIAGLANSIYTSFQ